MTTVNPALDAVLAMFAGSYKGEAKEETPKAPKAPKTPKTKKGSGTLHGAPPKVLNMAPAPTFNLPIQGTLDARGFIVKMRSNDRQEKIEAIHAYCGYSFAGNFGDQESAALAKAKREIRPLIVNPEEPFKARTITPTMAGFTVGLPDGTAREIANLLGREKMAQDTLVEQMKIADDKSKGLTERSIALGIAEVEKARIAEIRADLATLCGVSDPRERWAIIDKLELHHWEPIE